VDRPVAVSGATGRGELSSCRREEGGVKAVVRVLHSAGPASRFDVTVNLLDGEDAFAKATARTGLIQPGGSALVDVHVKVAGEVRGACELEDVTGV
jgi:hypothetical protein